MIWLEASIGVGACFVVAWVIVRVFKAVVKGVEHPIEQPDRLRISDLVYIGVDPGPYRDHFATDCRAVVIECSGDYGLFLEESGRSWWYPRHCLTLLERNRADLIDEWQADINVKGLG